MTITFVTKNKNKPEKWERVEIKENPFKNIAKEGETIPIVEIVNFIASPYLVRDSALRKIQKFCLHTTIDGYTDIRYYYEHGQN